jgi:1-deoxy-D-xylulose-5-phosphate reductoisomerase
MSNTRKRIAVLGITGSIGESTIEIVRHHSDRFDIAFASAHRDYKKLYTIAQSLGIKKIALSDSQIKQAHTDTDISLYQGTDELLSMIKNEDYDILINAITGSAGLIYTIATLESGKDLALANKESLVMAGHLVKELLQKHRSRLIPIDSEHSALYQILHDRDISQVRLLHITASGGALRDIPLSDFDDISVSQVLKHPTWDMGTKVTIDSATMMNKGLEVIEAHWLFDIPYHKIEAIIHPQSVIHSIVEFVDGSMLSQMSVPTMQLPILYALSHPERIPSDKVVTELPSLPPLTFDKVCPQRYPLFFMAVEAGKAAGIMPTILNSANEKAIDMLLKAQIKYIQMPHIVEKALQSYENKPHPDLQTIIDINEQVSKMPF